MPKSEGSGLHPYDWTDTVRRVWRGIPLLSSISTDSSKEFGDRYPSAE